MTSISRGLVGRSGWVATLVGGALALGVAPAAAVVTQALARGGEPLEARVRLDRGVDPVLLKGDQVRVYLWASQDAYLAVFRIDPDGRVRLVLPAGPSDAHRVEGGRDYQVPAPWQVEGQPGIGYYFVLASATPFDFGRLRAAEGSSEWELARGGVRIWQDPHLAMEGLGRIFVGERAGSPGAAIDFAAYHVGETFSYPRFLCYECHEAQAFESWNPYLQACPSVRVVISNDPYFYPATRYQGTRPAFPNPPEPGLAQYAFRPRQAGEPGTPLVAARSADAPRAQAPAPAAGADPRSAMLELLQRSGVAVAEGPIGPASANAAAVRGADAPGTPAGPSGGVPTPAAGPGGLDPRVPVVLTPAATDPAGRPTLQRR